MAELQAYTSCTEGWVGREKQCCMKMKKNVKNRITCFLFTNLKGRPRRISEHSAPFFPCNFEC